MRTHILLTLGAGLALSCLAAVAAPRFEGTVAAEWLPDGRRMKLTQTVRYFDETDTEWIAPKGWIVDGASIPQFAWSVVGGPFSGPHRDASVIHDYACDKKERPWRRVHRAFYSALLTAGVGETKALVMYAAVYHFGPRWSYTLAKRVVSDGEAQQAVSAMRASTEAPSPDESVRVNAHKILRSDCPPEIFCAAPQMVPSGRSAISATSIPASKRLTREAFAELQKAIESGRLTPESVEEFGR